MTSQRTWPRHTNSHRGQVIVEYCLILTVVIIVATAFSIIYRLNDPNLNQLLENFDRTLQLSTMNTLNSSQETLDTNGNFKNNLLFIIRERTLTILSLSTIAGVSIIMYIIDRILPRLTDTSNKKRKWRQNQKRNFTR